mmetsp:Transcript_1691/g.1841  ORF Transcript_1691/g.1841 Transcript_1691/m.1841 type:complete len:234 (-) Transcript_1691:310-1011(-)
MLDSEHFDCTSLDNILGANKFQLLFIFSSNSNSSRVCLGSRERAMRPVGKARQAAVDQPQNESPSKAAIQAKFVNQPKTAKPEIRKSSISGGTVYTKPSEKSLYHSSFFCPVASAVNGKTHSDGLPARPKKPLYSTKVNKIAPKLTAPSRAFTDVSGSSAPALEALDAVLDTLSSLSDALRSAGTFRILLTGVGPFSTRIPAAANTSEGSENTANDETANRDEVIRNITLFTG